MPLELKDIKAAYELLKKPYSDVEDGVNTTIYYGGVAYHRINHSLVHSVNKTTYLKSVIEFFSQHAIDKPMQEHCQKLLLNDELLRLLEICLLFSVTGREGECNFNTNPDKYKRYKENSICYAKKYLAEEFSHLPQDQINFYAETIRFMGGERLDKVRDDANLVDELKYNQRLLGFAHALDSLRYGGTGTYRDEIDDFEPYLQKNKQKDRDRNILCSLAYQVNVASGSEISTKVNFNYYLFERKIPIRDAFYDYAHNPERCFEEIYQVYSSDKMLESIKYSLIRDKNINSSKPPTLQGEFFLKIIFDYYWQEFSWKHFLEILSGESYHPLRSAKRGEFGLRLGHPDSDGQRAYEAFRISERKPLFSKQEKHGYTKHMPASYINLNEQYQPEALFYDSWIANGIIIPLNNALIHTIVAEDFCSFDRPGDQNTKEEVEYYLQQNNSNYFTSLEKLCSTRNNLANEVLIRIKLAKNYEIAVTNNVFSERISAQARAFDLQRLLSNKLNIKDVMVPIKIYQPWQEYTKEQQEDDLVLASEVDRGLIRFLKDDCIPKSFEMKKNIFQKMQCLSTQSQNAFLQHFSQQELLDLLKEFCKDLRLFNRGATVLLTKLNQKIKLLTTEEAAIIQTSIEKILKENLISFTKSLDCLNLINFIELEQYELIRSFIRYQPQNSSRELYKIWYNNFKQDIKPNKVKLVINFIIDQLNLFEPSDQEKQLVNLLVIIGGQNYSYFLSSIKPKINLFDQDAKNLFYYLTEDRIPADRYDREILFSQLSKLAKPKQEEFLKKLSPLDQFQLLEDSSKMEGFEDNIEVFSSIIQTLKIDSLAEIFNNVVVKHIASLVQLFNLLTKEELELIAPVIQYKPDNDKIENEFNALKIIFRQSELDDEILLKISQVIEPQVAVVINNLFNLFMLLAPSNPKQPILWNFIKNKILTIASEDNDFHQSYLEKIICLLTVTQCKEIFSAADDELIKILFTKDFMNSVFKKLQGEKRQIIFNSIATILCNSNWTPDSMTDTVKILSTDERLVLFKNSIKPLFKIFSSEDIHQFAPFLNILNPIELQSFLPDSTNELRGIFNTPYNIYYVLKNVSLDENRIILFNYLKPLIKEFSWNVPELSYLIEALPKTIILEALSLIPNLNKMLTSKANMGFIINHLSLESCEIFFQYIKEKRIRISKEDIIFIFNHSYFTSITTATFEVFVRMFQDDEALTMFFTIDKFFNFKRELVAGMQNVLLTTMFDKLSYFNLENPQMYAEFFSLLTTYELRNILKSNQFDFSGHFKSLDSLASFLLKLSKLELDNFVQLIQSLSQDTVFIQHIISSMNTKQGESNFDAFISLLKEASKNPDFKPLVILCINYAKFDKATVNQVLANQAIDIEYKRMLKLSFQSMSQPNQYKWEETKSPAENIHSLFRPISSTWDCLKSLHLHTHTGFASEVIKQIDPKAGQSNQELKESLLTLFQSYRAANASKLSNLGENAMRLEFALQKLSR